MLDTFTMDNLLDKNIRRTNDEINSADNETQRNCQENHGVLHPQTEIAWNTFQYWAQVIRLNIWVAGHHSMDDIMQEIGLVV